MPIVTCSRGHRFPVNLDKHRNRNHVFCPKCKEKVVVRKKHVFSSNPNWQKEKEDRRDARFEEKARRKRGESEYAFALPRLDILALSPLVMSRIIKEREEKEKAKKGD